MGETKKDILWRIYLVYGFICLFGLAILMQVFKLQFVQGDEWRAKADSLTLDYKKIEPARGNIYSHDGSLLATSVPVYDIYIDFATPGFRSEYFYDKVDSLAFCLAALFGDKSKADYKRFLAESKKDNERYVLFKKGISFNQVKRLKSFPVFRLGKYKGGLIVETTSKRIQPFQQLAYRTVGTKPKNSQPVGIEGAFDNYLKGVSGERLMQKISGNVWKPLNDENEIDPEEGKDVVTTIDIGIQDVAQNALRTQLIKHKAEAGCAVMMEVATGEIRAIANLSKTKDGSYHEDFNRAINQSTEPGSTFKLISLLAAMEDYPVDLDDSVDTQGGKIRWIASKEMKDSHDGGYGKISLKRAFEVSSNVGISKIVSNYYSKDPQKFIDRLHAMHVDRKLDLQIAGEGIPYIKNTSAKSWSKSTLPYMSIGYECRMTPLQILTFYNAVANNGRMVKPKFVKEIRQQGQTVKSFPVEVIVDSVFSSSTIKKAKELLEGVVKTGTASKLKHTQYTVAAKTGTARIANNNKGYEDESGIKYQASLVGYFPADNPKYSCIVVVYAPSNNIFFAAEVAGPIFKEMADKVYATSIDMHGELTRDSAFASNSLPDAKPGNAKHANRVFEKLNLDKKFSHEAGWVSINHSEKKSKTVPLKINKSTMPDVTGMGLRDAIYLLENQGLLVSVSGSGAVVKQSVAAGTKIFKGQQVTIELN